MKTSQYLSVIMSISALWLLLDVRSSALGFSLNLPLPSTNPGTSLYPQPQILRRNLSVAANTDANQDLKIEDLTVTRNISDKSLLTVTGSISNLSDRVHYVYYIVAKFTAKDVPIKQAIIPVNIDIEPGKSQSFTHEISTGSVKPIAPETVKPVVVKYEYR